MVEHEYDRTTSDHCVFVKKFSDGEFIILLLYVDDMLIVGHDTSKTDRLNEELSKSFALGIRKIDSWYVDLSWQEKCKIVAITRELYWEGIGQIQHEQGITGEISTCKSFKDKFKAESYKWERKWRNEESALCFSYG
jgi:hypothetical protein